MDPFCAPCVTRQPSAHVYYGTTRGMCSTCARALDAKIHFIDDQVWFHTFCPAHGHDRRLVTTSVSWYLDALSFLAPSTPPTGELRPVRAGCPWDCGPCVMHQQRFEEPVTAMSTEGLAALGDRFDALLADADVHVLEVDLRGATPGIPEAQAALGAHTGGVITSSDFVPSPLAHPHCYSILHLLVRESGELFPITRVLGRERMFDLLSEGHDLRRTLTDALVEAGIPAPRWKAIHIHAHMDRATFDVARVMRCSVGVTRKDGTQVPLCAERAVGDAIGFNNREPNPERRALPVLR